MAFVARSTALTPPRQLPDSASHPQAPFAARPGTGAAIFRNPSAEPVLNDKTLILAGVSFGVVLVTYIALNLIWPFKDAVETLPAGLKLETVFASDIASTQVAMPAPVVKPKPVAPIVVAAATAPRPAVPVAALPARTPKQPSPAPVVAASTPIVAAPKPVPPVTVSKPAPAPPVATASIAPAAKAPPPKPAAAPKLPQVSPRPNVAVAAPASVAAAVPAPIKAPQKAALAPQPAPPQALSQWWPKQPTPGRLNLLYAGQAASGTTLALLFDSTLPDSATNGTLVKVFDGQGNLRSVGWELNANRRMLLFKNLQPGRYSVVLSPGLSNQAGSVLATELRGPVYVR